MKLRIVKDRCKDEYLPSGGFTLMMPSSSVPRQRYYSGWFATKAEAIKYVLDRPTYKSAYEQDVLRIK